MDLNFGRASIGTQRRNYCIYTALLDITLRTCMSIVAGATGDKGQQGATGPAGRMNNVQNRGTSTTTTRRPPVGPCSGPVGEDASNTSDH